MKLEELDNETYQLLKSIARRRLRGERHNHSLTPTALVNEAYAKLAGRVEPVDQIHLKALMARKFQQVLIDYAKQRRKRADAAGIRVTIHDDVAEGPEGTVEVMALNTALDKLEGLNANHADAIRLKHFGGFKLNEIAEIHGVTDRTIRTWLRLAEAWLRRELGTDLDE